MLSKQTQSEKLTLLVTLHIRIRADCFANTPNCPLSWSLLTFDFFIFTVSCTVKPSFIEICNSFYLSSSSLHHLDESGGLDLCKFPLESCHKLHHDPRLSSECTLTALLIRRSMTHYSLLDWIVQKHSRHVKLKKSSHMTSPGIGTCPYPTMCYPFRVTTVFDVNKFIGILPFGERKLDTEAVKRFISQINAGDLFVPGAKLDSPFRTFVLEMT